MVRRILGPPGEFDVPAFANRWFHWSEISDCFWPGRGCRSEKAKPELAAARNLGGVYLMAWCDLAPTVLAPTAKELQYIGETNSFKNRMTGFGRSAGFWGERDDGHGPAWHWPKGRNRHLWVVFFQIPIEPLPKHLPDGLRKWMEAVALEEYRHVHGVLPPLQVASKHNRAIRL